jgi:hypothetical protein
MIMYLYTTHISQDICFRLFILQSVPTYTKLDQSYALLQYHCVKDMK